MKIFLLISALLLFETSVFANDNFWDHCITDL